MRITSVIVDTSALIAILRDGPATAACVHAIEDSADPPALHSNFSPIAVCTRVEPHDHWRFSFVSCWRLQHIALVFVDTSFT
jgi:hypothetical protein